MSEQKRHFPVLSFLRNPAVATACFLLLSAALIVCGVLLCGRFAKKELSRGGLTVPDATPAPTPSAHTALPTPSAATNDTETQTKSVSAVYVPAPAETPAGPSASWEPALPAEDASPSPAQSASPTPAISASPAPTLRPVTDAPAVTRERADFLFVMLDGDGHADWIAAVHLDADGARVLSVPKNTLSAAGAPLYDAVSAARCARMLPAAFPVRYTRTVEFQLTGLAACVDQFGGIRLDGALCDGEETLDYLSAGGAEELLRIEREQAVMRAYLSMLREQTWLKLLSSKLALDEYVKSSLTVTELFELYALFLGTSDADVTFSVLPVDSCTADGARFYVPDAALVNKTAAEFVP